MSPLSKDETGLGCSGLLAFLQLALCRPISLVWLGIGTLSISLISHASSYRALNHKLPGACLKLQHG